MQYKNMLLELNAQQSPQMKKGLKNLNLKRCGDPQMELSETY